MEKYFQRDRISRSETHGTRKGRLTTSLLALTALALTGLTAQASDIGVLRIENESNATQSFIVIDDYFRCMDFPLPTKAEDGSRTTIDIPANGFTDTQFARDGSCDPEGRFLIMAMDRKTGQPFGNAIAFEASGDANLWRIWEAESPTPHAPGIRNIGKDYASGKLTYVLDVTLPGYNLGVPEGLWTDACGGGQGCNQKIFSNVENTVSSEESSSKEVMNAFSATISGGFEFGGASGGTELTMSSETTTSQALTLANSGTTGKGTECETDIDMKEYQVANVWQWTIQSIVGNKKIATTTCQVTCTPTKAPPTYLPGAPESINACLVKRTDETEVAAVAAATAEQVAAKQQAEAQRGAAAAQAKAAQNRAASCVTFYTGANGSGTPAMVCGADQSGWTGSSVEYANLGTPGTNSHHYDIVSFKCAPGVGYVQFMNGNATPMSRHNESCKGGAVVTPSPWVKANATGAGIYLKPQKCCGE